MVIDQLAAYCEKAQAEGVVEIALTEHLHRFTQLDAVVGKFWEGAPGEQHLEASMAAYFDHHAQADLDAYVELCLEAKRQGLPVVMGMEVDYYRGMVSQNCWRSTPSTCSSVRSTGSASGASTTSTVPWPWPSGRPERSTPAGTPTPRL